MSLEGFRGLGRAARLSIAMLSLLLGCQDVSIGRQLPRDGAVDVRRERVLPMPDASVTLRALEVGPLGEVVLLAQFTGSADFGDGERRTATSEGGDGVLLVFEADGTLRAKRVLSAEFLTLYRAVRDEGRIHLTGLFRGDLTDGDPLGSSPSAQTAIALAYDLDGARVDTRTLASASGFGNVQGKGIDARGDRLLRCGNYLDAIDAGGGPLPSAGIDGDNGYLTVVDGSGPVWAEALATPEGGRGAYGQNCAFTPDGGVVLAADFDGRVTVHGGDQSADGLDAVVASYAPGGSAGWLTRIGGPGDQELNPLAVRSGLVLVGGSTDAPFDLGSIAIDQGIFVAALDAGGTPRWAWSAPGVRAVTGLDGSGPDIVAAGFFEGSAGAGWVSAGGTDGFVAGLGDDGALRWSHTFGSSGDDTCLGHASGSELAVVCSFGAALESPGGTPIPDGGALWIGHVAVDR